MYMANSVPTLDVYDVWMVIHKNNLFTQLAVIEWQDYIIYVISTTKVQECLDHYVCYRGCIFLIRYCFQVTDHLKEAAKGINIRVVPIVGGMSTEKQERLLKARPEVIVGTPGRLWELMSGGEKHLVEVSAKLWCIRGGNWVLNTTSFHNCSYS